MTICYDIVQISLNTIRYDRKSLTWTEKPSVGLKEYKSKGVLY